MKFTLSDLGLLKPWISERLGRGVRQYPKEIAIALAVAIVAAIIIDPIWTYRQRQLRQLALRDNLKAFATLEIFDPKNKPVHQGSGFFINPNGVLLTNFHVIKGAGRVIAHLPSGAFYVLREIAGANEGADIAILQFDARETPSVHGFGNSDLLKIGDQVFVLGAPNGLEAAYSAGVVSNPTREINGHTFIQF